MSLFSKLSAFELSNQEIDDFSTLTTAQLRKKYGKKIQPSKKSKDNKATSSFENNSKTTVKPPKKFEKLDSKTSEVLNFSSTSTNNVTTGKSKKSKKQNINPNIVVKEGKKEGKSSVQVLSINSDSDKGKLIEAFRTLTQPVLKEIISSSKDAPAIFCEKFSKLFQTFHFVPNLEKPAEPLKFLTSNQQMLREWGDNLSSDEATVCIQILLNYLLTAQGQFNLNANVSQLVLLQILAQQQPRSYLSAISNTITSKFSKDFNTKSVRNLIWLISQLDQEPSLAVQLFLQAFVNNPDLQSPEFMSRTEAAFNSNDFPSSLSKDKSESKLKKSVVLSNQSKSDILLLLDDIVEDFRNQKSPQIHNIHQKLYIALLKFKYTHFFKDSNDSLSLLISFITKQLLTTISTNHAQYFILLWNLLNTTVNNGHLSNTDKNFIKNDLLERLGQFFEADPKTCADQWETIYNKSPSHKNSSRLIFNHLMNKKPPLNRSAKSVLSSIKKRMSSEKSEEVEEEGQSSFCFMILIFIVSAFAFVIVASIILSLVCKEMVSARRADTLISLAVHSLYKYLDQAGISTFLQKSEICHVLPW